jgi:hypothetical protein
MNSYTEDSRKAAARAISSFCSGVTRAFRRFSFSDRRAVFAVRLMVLSDPPSYDALPDTMSESASFTLRSRGFVRPSFSAISGG